MASAGLAQVPSGRNQTQEDAMSAFFTDLVEECREMLDRYEIEGLSATRFAEALTGVSPLILHLGGGRHRVFNKNEVWDVIPAPGFGPNDH